MGKLDEISQAIGGLQASVTGLQGDIAKLEEQQESRARTQDDRHNDNQIAFGALRQDLQKAIAELRVELRTAVNGNGNGHTNGMSSPRIAILTSVGVGTLVALAWSLEAGVKWLVSWILSHLH